MSLINSEQMAPNPVPSVPGEGPIVYWMEHDPWLICARLPEDKILAEIYSWCAGDREWLRCWAC